VSPGISEDVDREREPAVEDVYRLRAGLEVSRAVSAAADFYYGELDARRRTALWQSVDRYLLPCRNGSAVTGCERGGRSLGIWPLLSVRRCSSRARGGGWTTRQRPADGLAGDVAGLLGVGRAQLDEPLRCPV
jgi:hypothetical protein